MQDSYRDNYSLDVDKVGLLDGLFEVFNGLANVIFSMVKSIAYAAINFFYRSLTFDITHYFSDIINTMQAFLKNSVFEPLLLLALFFSAVTVLKRFLQQNMVGILTEFCKVIILILISIFLVNDSSTVLKYSSNITKSVSLSAFTGVNSLANDAEATLKDYAIDAAGILWQNMVHEPWKSLEFGGVDLGEDEDKMAEKFLSTLPGSEERENLVAQYAETQAFAKGRVFPKIGNSLIYLIVIMIKSILYIAVAGIMFTYQIFSIFYLLIAPLILILAFFPSYQSIVNVWFKKFIEVQVCIFIITLALGLIVKLDSIIFNATGDLGWFMALIFQIVTIFFLYKERDKIIHAFSNVQKAIEVPAYANAMLRNRLNAQNLPKTVNQIKNIPSAAKGTANDAKNAAAHTKDAITSVATRVSLGMHGMGWTKAGMEKRAEEASAHDTMQKMTLQHARPDLYKSMQKQEQENERRKDYGSIRLRMVAANQTLDEMRAYEKEKARTERKNAAASENYSNIIKFEDRPRLRTPVVAPKTVQAATTEEAHVDMRTDDNKTITSSSFERPTLDRGKNMSVASSQNASISSLNANMPNLSSNNISVQNQGIQGGKDAATKQSTPAYSHTQAQAAASSARQTVKQQHTPRASGSFTAIETNAPVNTKNKKAERPKLNTGQYKEEVSAPKRKSTAPKIFSAKKVK